MEKEELGGKNGFGAERNSALSKLFLNGIARFYFHFLAFFYFYFYVVAYARVPKVAYYLTCLFY